MKVLLVKPGIKLGDHIQPPLGLAYLASCLRNEHSVKILDLPKYGRNIFIFKKILQQYKPDVIGFQCYSVEVNATKVLVNIAKRQLSRVVVILGGPHPSLCPAETVDIMRKDVDFLIRGEGENSFPELLRNLHNRKKVADIKGLVYRENGQIHINNPELISDLDKLPQPAWDLIKPQEYPPAQHGAFFKRFPIAPIITTRGCPFECVFCSAPLLSGKKIRKRNPKMVMKEIELLYNKFGVREIHIVDDNFTLDKNHAISILKEIVASRLPITLAFPNGIRLNTLDEELLDLMKKSGVYLISVGIESGSDRTLKRMNKRLNIEIIREKVKLIQSKGIDLAAFFIIGFPDETLRDIRETIRFSLDIPLLRANYFTFLPLPMTPIYNKLQQKGELKHIDSSNLLFECAPYAPKTLTHKKLRNLQRESFARFYLRPRILYSNLLQIRSLKHFWYLLKRFYHWVLM